MWRHIVDIVENYSLYTPSLEASPGGQWQPGGASFLRSAVALPEDKGKGWVIADPMIPTVGTLYNPA